MEENALVYCFEIITKAILFCFNLKIFNKQSELSEFGFGPLQSSICLNKLNLTVYFYNWTKFCYLLSSPLF